MWEAIHRALSEGTSGVDPNAVSSLKTILNTGAVSAATLSAVESAGFLNKTVITLTDFAVTTGNTAGASFGATKFYDFPKGLILTLGAVADFSEVNWVGSDIAVGGSGDFSLGSTATADASLASTEVNILPSSALLDPFVAGVGTGSGKSTAVAFLDGTATAADAYLNVIIDDADVADAAANDVVYFTGRIMLSWVNLGQLLT